MDAMLRFVSVCGVVCAVLLGAGFLGGDGAFACSIYYSGRASDPLAWHAANGDLIVIGRVSEETLVDETGSHRFYDSTVDVHAALNLTAYFFDDGDAFLISKRGHVEGTGQDRSVGSSNLGARGLRVPVCGARLSDRLPPRTEVSLLVDGVVQPERYALCAHRVHPVPWGSGG